MKRSFTILTAAIALLAFLAIPMGMWGQTRESYTVTYDVEDLGDMFVDGSSYASANGYWKVPATSNNIANISIPITYQPESNITVTFSIATFGNGTNPSASNTTITAVGTESNSNWSGSGVSTYPSSASYVNGVMTITKPQTPTTLGGLEVTMGVNTGVKIFRLQSITVAYTYGGGSQTDTYSVTYNCNGGTTGCPENATGIEAGEEITLANAPTKDGFDFDGWSDGNTTYQAGASYTVNSNVTMTAQWTEQSSGDEHWVLTELADLTSSDVFVMVGNNSYAMTNNNGTSTAPATVAVTIANNEITSTVAANVQWTVSGNATNGYSFYPNGSTSTWLYCNTTSASSNNNNIRVGTGNRKVFELSTNNYLITNDTYADRYLSIYNNADWRGYTNTSNGVATMSFYKKVTGGVIPPSITAANVDIEYNATSGNIAYTVNNEIDGGTLTATTESNWLTLGEVGTTVPFTCTANEASTARTATVTLTYTYNRETVTKDVTVTQAAAPVIYTTIPALFEAATNAGNTATDVVVTFGNWVVTGANNSSHAFVSDGTNGFMIYGTGHGFSAGNVLSGTVECKVQLFNGAIEITQLTSTTTGLTVTPGGTVTVANIAMADLAGINTGALVSYQNLTCEARVEGNYTNYYLSDGTTEIQAYKTLLNNYADYLEGGKTYNITGVFVLNNSTKRINPRSADDIVEVEVQHEEYTLTVSNLSHVDLFVFGGEESETLISTEDGETTAQVYDGTEVTVSIEVEEGYVFQSLTITDANGDPVETEELEPNVYYGFTMPTSNVTITATAVEYVAPVGGDYVRITSLDQLTDGSKVIIAARYDENTANGYYAMKTTLTSGKATGVNFTSTTSDGNEILPASIVDDEDDYYWTVNVTENGYTFTNASDETISYGSSTNFNYTGSNTEWTITRETADVTAMVAEYIGFVIRNGNTNTRAFAFNGSAFGPYSTSNMNAGGYNFFLDFFVQTEAAETETYTLTIDGYVYDNVKDGYYLIASPVTVDPATVEGMTDGDFDLYYFDESQDDEWRNYEATAFNLVPGKGYLYAKKATTENPTYSFELTGIPYNNQPITLSKSTSGDFPGWNLVGNPLGETALLSDNRDFYVMNNDGSDFIQSNGAIGLMQGIFVIAAQDGEELVFTAANGTNLSGEDKLVLNLTKGCSLIDRAVVRFGEGRTLPKFMLNQDNTKLYITEGNQDFAVVRSNNEGEMPVSFKAAENGNYTLSVDAENVEVSYLHLIDNMTGTNVDLLATPSYSFDALTTDNANRFRLMFNTTDVDENTTMASFAYFNGSSWTISTMGEATLQVIDMMGRVISTQAISGNADVNLNQTAGVYMLRLVNGENVMVQKVVVK